MRIFISSIDESGTNRTTRLLLGQCSNTSVLIKQICKEMRLEREYTIIKLKHQPYNLIILDNWPVNHYPIKNGSIFIVEITENSVHQEFNKSQKEILTKVQQEESYESSQSSSYLHSFLSITQNSPNHQRQQNYSKYLQDSLSKILQAVRNSNLQKIAQILKEQPQLNDEEQIGKAMQKKYKYLLNQVGQCGRNALHWSIFTKNVDIASFLIIKGSNPTLLTYDEYSPLQLAVINKTPQILTLLLEQKRIDINQITPHKTALHIAVANEDIKSIEILLQNDVDTQTFDDQGKKAVDITDNSVIKKLLLKKTQIRQVKNPNITKGNVFRVSSMTYRMKERIIVINPFKNDVLIQKMSNEVEDKFQITFIESIQQIQKESWLMSSDYYYFKITLGDKDKKQLKFGVRHEEIRQKWVYSIKKCMKYRQNIVYIKPVPAYQQLIQFLNDEKNESTLHKRRVEKQMIPNKKMTKSIFDLCPQEDSQHSQQKIRERIQLRKSDSRFANFSQKFLMSDNVSNESEIIMGSIVKDSNNLSVDLSQYASIIQSSIDSSFVDKEINKMSFRKNQLNKSEYVVSEFKVEDPPNKISFRDFQLMKLLGNGSFGQVYLTKYLKNGHLYALKILNKKKLINKKQLKYAVSEASILKKVDFPFIINLHFSFQTPLHLYLALDNCTNGDLAELIIVKQKLSESTSRFIIAQIILALEYLHNNNILYRDLKPQNVLLASDGYVRLTDFGLSKENCFSMSFCGSPAYLSPQMLQKKGVGFSTDIYGIGCVLFQMMTGEPPFFDQNLDVLFQNIKAGKLRYPSYLSIQSKSLISKLLQRDINKRIGCKNFSQIKKHDFFKKIDWNLLLRKKYPPPNEIYLNDQQLHFYPEIQLEQKTQLKLDDMEYEQSAQKISRIKNFTFIRNISSAFGKKKA